MKLRKVKVMGYFVQPDKEQYLTAKTSSKMCTFGMSQKSRKVV